MRSTVLFLLMTVALGAADPLPVVPMKTDPESLVHRLLNGPYITNVSDCDQAVIEICPLEFPETDVTLRWVQLDDDPELEAVVISRFQVSSIYFGYVFDRRGTKWNQVGALEFSREDTGNDLFRVEKLTPDAPTFLLYYRDLGGSASSIFTTTAYSLHDGKLWPAIDITNLQWNGLPPPETTERQTVFASKDRLVIHTSTEQNKRVRNTCEVHRWEAKTLQYIPAPADRAASCNPQTGKPIPGKADRVALPLIP